MSRFIAETRVWLLFAALSFLTFVNAFWYWIFYYSAILLAWWLIGNVHFVFWVIPFIFYGVFGALLLIPTEITLGYRNITTWLNRAYKNEDTILEVKFNNKTIFKV